MTGMGLFAKLKRKNTVDPAERRRHLLATGLITEGTIIDCKSNAEGGTVIVFVYTLNGVDFESSDILTPEQQAAETYVPGAKVGIRFEPRNQYNSVVE